MAPAQLICHVELLFPLSAADQLGKLLGRWAMRWLKLLSLGEHQGLEIESRCFLRRQSAALRHKIVVQMARAVVEALAL